jgi:hypothetical protein
MNPAKPSTPIFGWNNAYWACAGVCILIPYPARGPLYHSSDRKLIARARTCSHGRTSAARNPSFAGCFDPSLRSRLRHDDVPAFNRGGEDPAWMPLCCTALQAGAGRLHQPNSLGRNPFRCRRDKVTKKRRRVSLRG